ncbi:hypothetical protein DFP97_120115 [Paenibacillus prosopidis]|uniref:Uncharacterized protein n=1 Tax=Paenibacillus prosopidis TaxID=630520 RepID=A0A368VK20_9BACL|nr:hypothetical protein DFP97_120115 [Paenibacillus prosopidis]
MVIGLKREGSFCFVMKRELHLCKKMTLSKEH